MGCISGLLISVPFLCLHDARVGDAAAAKDAGSFKWVPHIGLIAYISFLYGYSTRLKLSSITIRYDRRQPCGSRPVGSWRDFF